MLIIAISKGETNTMLYIWLIIFIQQQSLFAKGDLKIGIVLEGNSGSERSTALYAEDYINTEIPLPDNVTLSVIVKEVGSRNAIQASTLVCDLLKEGVAGIITYSSCSTLKYVESQLQNFHIPHLGVHYDHCQDKAKVDGFTLRLQEKETHLTEALTDISKHQNWKEVAIIYDNSMSDSQIRKLVLLLSRAVIKSSLYYVDHATTDRRYNVTLHLAKIKSSPVSFRRLMVLLNEEHLLRTIQEAFKIGLLSKNFNWLIAQSDVLLEEMQHIQTNYINVAVVNKKRKAVTIRKDCFMSRRLQNMTIFEKYIADSVAIYSETFRRLLSQKKQLFPKSLDCGVTPYMTWKQGDMVYSAMKTGTISAISRRFSFDLDGYSGNNTFDIFSLENSSRWNLVGNWEQKGRLNLKAKMYPNELIGFGNVIFRVASKESLPFNMKIQEGNNTKYVGLCYDILDELAARLHFRYEIIPPADGMVGSPEGNGSWTGVIGMVQRKEVEFAIGPISISTSRESVIDFTKPFMEDGVGIMLKRPTETNKTFRMFEPFTGYVWLTLAVTLLIIGVSLSIVNRLSPYNGTDHSQKSITTSVTENTWLIFGLYMEQGGYNPPKAVSGRIILGVWWVFTILMVSSYTANLAAFLTVTIAVKPIKNLEELAQQTAIKPLVRKGTNTYMLFEKPQSETYQTIWNMIKAVPEVIETNEVLALVASGGYAYLTDKTQLEYIQMKECAEFVLADEMFNMAGFGFVLPEGSPLLQDFSYNIIKMQEAGLITRWRQKWWRSSDKCGSGGIKSIASGLGLDSTGGPFLIFLSSVVIAFLCLVVEVTLSKYNERKTVQNEIIMETKMPS